jgi:hypothetical protein
LTLQCKSLAQQINDLKDEISLCEDKIKEGTKKYETLKEDKFSKDCQ